MRQVTQDLLTERNRQVLRAVIIDYIETAEPVGSRTIARKHGVNLSPATVRNIMADLEEAGYLAQPHTSAGRVPTDRGFRIYVDTLLEVEDLSTGQKERIQRTYRGGGGPIEEVLRETSRVLSSVSQQAALVMVPRFPSEVLRHIEFVVLGDYRILAILVSKTGIVQNRIVHWEERITQDDLEKMARYLNGILADRTLTEVRQTILEEMQKAQVLYDRLRSQALRLSQQALDAEGQADVYVEGTLNILNQPEFANVAQMRDLLRALEEKSTLVNLLDRTISARGVQLFIGSELSELIGCSLIASTYGPGDAVVGSLAVIGPTRMNYSRLIPLVSYTAAQVSRILEES